MDREEEGLEASNDHPPPQLVATATPSTHPPPKPPLPAISPDPSIFTALHWSPDGTTLLLTTSSQTLETYILPLDLLSAPSISSADDNNNDNHHHHTLHPYPTSPLPSPSSSTTIHPSFTLSLPQTCLYLTSPRHLPIRLTSPFATQSILASYPLIHTRTETYAAANALLFNPLDHGASFFAGAGRVVAQFDVERDGEGPVGVCVLGQGRKRHGGSSSFGGMGYLRAASEGGVEGRGINGVASALDVGVERGVLAVGMYKGKCVGLLDGRGVVGEEGGVVGTLTLPEEGQADGVTSVRFCPKPGRGDYLLVAERVSEVMRVFDVRKGGVPLATLRGREALTHQRLGVDVTEDGEVWAGGTDGMVRVWEGMGMREGDVDSTSVWQGHQDAISGLGLHPGGAGVLATCAGSRHLDDSGESEGAQGRNGGFMQVSDESSDSDSSSLSDVSISSTSSVSSSSASDEPSIQKPTREGLKIWAL